MGRATGSCATETDHSHLPIILERSDCDAIRRQLTEHLSQIRNSFKLIIASVGTAHRLGRNEEIHKLEQTMRQLCKDEIQTERLLRALEFGGSSHHIEAELEEVPEEKIEEHHQLALFRERQNADDDVFVAREERPLICPISKVRFVDPVRRFVGFSHFVPRWKWAFFLSAVPFVGTHSPVPRYWSYSANLAKKNPSHAHLQVCKSHSLYM